MKRFIFVPLMLAVCVLRAATHTATSLDHDEVQSKLTEASEPNAVVVLPAGVSPGWSAGVVWNAPVGATIIGAGTSAQGGGDQTVLVDNVVTGNSYLIEINIPSTGFFRFTGITVRGGTGIVKDERGVLRFIGPSDNTVATVRVDHCTLDQQTYTSPGGTHFPVFANAKGVVDHCILNYFGNGAAHIYRPGASGTGNEVWAADTGFGTDDFVYFEDNIFNGGAAVIDAAAVQSRGWDLNEGAKAVLRFNTMYFCSGGEIHALGHNGNGRSGRATETYGNRFSKAVNQDSTGRTPRVIQEAEGGTALIWGNTMDAGAVESYTKFHTVRSNSLTYPQTPPPNGWGYTGPVATGTVNVSGTSVTWVSGDHFSTSWPVNTMIYIVGALSTAFVSQQPGGNLPSCAIASVNSPTSITLTNGGHTGSDLTGAAYYMGSAWDGNTSLYGYPAIDQTGRGRGDLITGDHPSKINSTTGTIAWPNEALEPVYLWNNSGTPTVVDYSNAGSPNLIMAGRDFYKQASGIQTSPTSPFDGTTTDAITGAGNGGVGWGTLGNRPTTCTVGVGYFATDQGSWNQSTSNPYGVQMNGADGLFYVCTSTNTWTLYYTPYTYPHPLQGTSNTVTVSGNLNVGTLVLP